MVAEQARRTSSKESRLNTAAGWTTVGSFVVAVLTYLGVRVDRLPIEAAYLAIAVLVAAAVWNVWLRRSRRARERESQKMLMLALREQWPKFQRLVREFSLFFDQGQVQSIYYVLDRVNVTREQKLDFSWYVSGMNAFAFAILRVVKDVEPQSPSEALAFSYAFESLKSASFNSPALSALRDLEPHQNWKATRDTYLADLEHFRRKYHDFAEEANAAIGQYVFTT